MSNTQASSIPSARRRGRWWRWPLYVFLALAFALALALGGLFWWASTPNSLPRALTLAQKYLPAKQELQFANATGSITGGGSIEQLQWAMPGTVLTVDKLVLDWSLSELWGRALNVRTLQADRVRVQLSPQPDKVEEASRPFQMPSDVSLPIQVQLPVRIGVLEIESAAEDGTSSQQQIRDIAAHYAYDGSHHDVRLHSLHYAQSQLQAAVQLHARTLDLNGEVVAYLAGLVPDQAVRMLVPLEIDGTLAGQSDARVRARVQALQLPAEFAVPVEAGSMLLPAFADRFQADAAWQKLDATATLYPWRSQPVEQVNAVLKQLNAQDFHGQAPLTDLNGSVQLNPLDNGSAARASLTDAVWTLVLDVQNQQPGPWDAQRIPASQIQANAELTMADVQLHQASIQLGEGSLVLQGRADLQQQSDSAFQVTLAQLNLQHLLSTLPQTLLEGAASIEPVNPQAVHTLADASWNIALDVRNALPGFVDQQKLPLNQLQLTAAITPELWRAEALNVTLDDGGLELQGQFNPQSQALNVEGQLRQLPLVQVHSQLAAERAPDLSGTLKASGNLQEAVNFAVDISSDGRAQNSASPWNIRALQGHGRWAPTELSVEQLFIDAFQARVDAKNVHVALPDLSSVQAVVTASAPGLALNADAAMQQQSGGGNVALRIASAEQLMRWARDLPVVGSSLPEVQASGDARINADWQGGWQQWVQGLQNPAAHPNLRVNAQAVSENLRLVLPAAAQQGQTAAEPVRIDVKRLDASLQGNLNAASLTLDGDVNANGLRAQLDASLEMAQAAASGNNAPVWNITVNRLDAAATLPDAQSPWRVSVQPGLAIAAQTGGTTRITTNAGGASVTPPAEVAPPSQALSLAWTPLTFVQNANGGMQVQSQGTINGMQLSWVDALTPEGQAPLADAGIFTNLVLSGQWNVDMADSLTISASLQRESGDLWLGEPEVPVAEQGNSNTTEVNTEASRRSEAIAAGIRALNLSVRSQGNSVVAGLNWDTERAGVVMGEVRTQLEKRGQSWALADNPPLDGQVRASFPDLGVWGFVAPPGWRITGALEANVAIAGTVQQPLLQGQINGSALNARSILDGVDLHNGQLRAELDGHRLNIRELSIQGGTGSHAYVAGMSGNRTPAPTERGQLLASGFIDWGAALNAQGGAAQGSGIMLDVKAQLQQMQVLVRNDRQVSLSGDLSAGLQNGALRLRGDLTLDRASITLPESGAPTLGDDVVVIRSSDPPAAQGQPVGTLQTAQPMDMEIGIDLGRDFALQGYGMTTRLEGRLTIRSQQTGNDPFSIVGEIRTDEGRYRAWGQALNVETGIILFSGPYNNPSLNILAIRPNIEVRAGARVTGTALAPRVQLYSEPDLPDAEKLSWVVLGRSPAAGGAEGNAMQQAALSLLAGSVGNSLADGFGFDEVGISAEGVSVGKRLSEQMYVTYVASMSGAAGTLYVFYDITRRLTARGETGEQSAVDLIYTITYD